MMIHTCVCKAWHGTLATKLKCIVDVTNQFGICLYNMTLLMWCGQETLWACNIYTHTHTHTHTHQQTVFGQDLAHGGKIMLAKIVAKILPRYGKISASWQDLGLLPSSCSSWQESCPKTLSWDQTREYTSLHAWIATTQQGLCFKSTGPAMRFSTWHHSRERQVYSPGGSTALLIA
jgi:hypothetical protein